MNKAQIIQFLDYKLLDICKALYSEETKELVRTKAYFAGGCVRDLARGITPKDFDLYFLDEDSRDRFCELTNNEFALIRTQIGNFNQKSTKAQFITIINGLPEDVVEQFDFTVNQGYYLPVMRMCSIGEMGYELKVCPKVLSPMNALVRLKKFEERGYTYDMATLIAVGVAISHMSPITDVSDLEDALKGLSNTNIDMASQVFERHANHDEIPF